MAAKGSDNGGSFWTRRKWWILTSAGLLVLLSVLGLSSAFFTNLKSDRPTDVAAPQIQIYRGVVSVAVLPFLNSNVTSETENFSEWLAQELVNVSNSVSSLRTVQADAVAFRDGAAIDVPAIGKRLGVDALLQGSVRSTAGRLQVSVELVAVRNAYHLWSDIYDCQPGETVLTQHVIARAVVNALKSSQTYLKFPDQPHSAIQRIG